MADARAVLAAAELGSWSGYLRLADGRTLRMIDGKILSSDIPVYLLISNQSLTWTWITLGESPRIIHTLINSLPSEGKVSSAILQELGEN